MTIYADDNTSTAFPDVPGVYIDIDDCRSHPCQNEAVCIDKINQYRCECAPGYESDHCEAG